MLIWNFNFQASVLEAFLYNSNDSGKEIINLGMIHAYITPFSKEKFPSTYN